MRCRKSVNNNVGKSLKGGGAFITEGTQCVVVKYIGQKKESTINC